MLTIFIAPCLDIYSYTALIVIVGPSDLEFHKAWN